MLDLKFVRNNLEVVAEKCALRNFTLDINKINDLENNRKIVQNELQDLQNQRNTYSKNIGIAKSKQVDISFMLNEVEEVNAKLARLALKLEEIQTELDNIYIHIPNLLQNDVPIGSSENDNVEIKKYKEPKHFCNPKDHVSLGEDLGGMDFEAASKLSGSRFVVLKGSIAHLQRALTQFMLDVHTTQHGYQEVYAPLLVKTQCLYGTAQFPKLLDDVFGIQNQDLWLIPTAEVSLTNLVRETILEEKELPLKWVAHTPCFRAEAGTYGKDTRGMLRQHQFEKIELVQIVRPDDSFKAHEELTAHAESILQLLDLPYRLMALCSGDVGFGSTKTYDLEVWLPGQNRYREISSCSHFGDFQARRMQARFKNLQTNKTEYVHTVNGSGLAVGRTLIAVIENYQQADGSIAVPSVLQAYMNGLTTIDKGKGNVERN
ncbi:MAG: serS [Francisellaceae bacterium]|nr:serS [Francisellaceae bacterium]